MGFRLAQRTGDCTLYLSGWSQSRLQPTYSMREEDGLIWIDRAKFDRWTAKHNSFYWPDEELFEVPVQEGKDRGGERFRRINRRSAA